MTIALLIPAILSCLLLAAHFLRHDSLILVGVSLIVPVVLFIRRAWVVRLMQVVLVIAALEWIRTLVITAEARLDANEPWKRMAAILGGVALWTLISALLFELPPLRQRYRRIKPPADIPEPHRETVEKK